MLHDQYQRIKGTEEFRGARFASTIAAFVVALTSFSPPAWCGQSISVDDSSETKSVVVYALNRIPKGALILDKDLEDSIINSRGISESQIAIRRFTVGRRSKYEIAPGQIIMENLLVQTKRLNNNQVSFQKHTATFVQAKNEIPAGRIILLKDLRTGSVKTIDSASWISTSNQVVGKQSKNRIFKGQIFTKDIAFK